MKPTPTVAPIDRTDWRPEIEGRSKPVYLAIADAIAEDVRAGTLHPGQRLPPQRQLAERLGIDFTTVSRAYVEARHRGLVDARVGQGTFVRTAPGGGSTMPPSPAAESRDRPPPVDKWDRPQPAAALVDMTMNQPPLPADPALLARLRGSMAAAVAELDFPDLLHYPAAGRATAPGARDDRAAGAAWVAPRLPGVAPERVLVTPGTQGALLALLAALTRPGDVVCTDALTYPGFRAVAGQLGLRLVGVAMDEDGVDPDALRQAFALHRPKAYYCMPTFHNPTTATLPLERRHAVVAALREHGVAAIEDDVYGPLPDNPLPPLAALAPEAVHLVAGLAKCLSPVLRISYLVSPDARQSLKIAAAQRTTTLMPSPLTAAIAGRWIADGTATAVLDALRAEAANRQALARTILPAGGFAGQAESFHVWLRLPESWSRGEFTAHLRARGIAAVASDAFAVTPGGGPAGLIPEALRLCLGAARDAAETRRILEIVADTLDQLPSAAAIVI